MRGKGYLGYQPFFPREIDSFALELWFIVDFVCQIVFRKMGNKFPFDVTAKGDREPAPPPPRHRFTTRAGLPDGSWRHFESFSYPEPALPLSMGTVIWPIRAQPISYPESSGFLVSGIELPKKPEYDPKTTRRTPEGDPKTLLGEKQILLIRDTRLRAVRNDIHSDGPGFPLCVIFWEKNHVRA